MTGEPLALKLRVLRARKGLTLTEAAGLAGVRYETISDLEHGARRAQSRTLNKLAEAYGVDVAELLSVEGEVEARPKYRAASAVEAVRKALLDAASHDYLTLGMQGNLRDAQDMSIPEILVRLQDLGRERNALVFLYRRRYSAFEDPRTAKAEIERIRRPYTHTVMELVEAAAKKAPTEEERQRVRDEFEDELAALYDELAEPVIR
jgi:transcriptional regulator with XRE-family HTH domain